MTNVNVERELTLEDVMYGDKVSQESASLKMAGKINEEEVNTITKKEDDVKMMKTVDLVNQEEVTKEVNNNEENTTEEKVVIDEMLYFVLGRNGNVISAANRKGTSEVKLKKAASGEINVSTSVLCLEEINRILSILSNAKNSGYVIDRPMGIRTINTLVQSINAGNFKYWIKTGKYSNGIELDPRELNAWAKFAELYKELFLEVNFYKQNISPKNNTPIANVERTIISKIWENLPEAPIANQNK